MGHRSRRDDDSTESSGGRASKWQYDLASLKTAAMCVTAAGAHFLEANHDRTKRAHAIDQAELAVRLLREFIAAQSSVPTRNYNRKRDYYDRNRNVTRQRYRQRAEAGLCPRCGDPRADDSVHCPEHRDAARARRARP